MREALFRPLEGKPDRARIHEWAEQMAALSDHDARMMVLRWLEGPSPREGVTAEDLEDEPATDADGNAIEP